MSRLHPSNVTPRALRSFAQHCDDSRQSTIRDVLFDAADRIEALERDRDEWKVSTFYAIFCMVIVGCAACVALAVS